MFLIFIYTIIGFYYTLPCPDIVPYGDLPTIENTKRDSFIKKTMVIG
jgi:hypothetical protein